MMSANLRAFLALIRWAEGTAGPDGYRTMVGGKLFNGFDDHPRSVQTIRFGQREIHSTAAGAYQFLANTWDRCCKALDLPDFSPESQDKAAVWLIQQRGALLDVEQGRLRDALEKCSWEWASLPPSRYGQPNKSYDACEVIFERAGGIVSQAAGPTTGPVSPVPPPVAVPPAPSQEKRMSPLVIPAITAVIDAVPSLMRIFKGGSKTVERNAAAVEVIGQVIKEATGESTVAGAAERVISDPEAAARVEKIVQERYYEVAEAGGGGIEGARGWAEKMTAGDDWRAVGYGVLIGTLSLVIVLGGGVLMAALMFDGQTSGEQRGMLIGALVAFVSSVVAYFFGSSASSRTKDQTIADQARR